MSSDQRPPSEPTPELPPSEQPSRQPAPPPSSSPDGFSLARLQQLWQEVQPVLRSQSIRLLRVTSRTLAGVADRLETETPAPSVTLPPEAIASQPLSASAATPELTDSEAIAPPSPTGTEITETSSPTTGTEPSVSSAPAPEASEAPTPPAAKVPPPSNRPVAPPEPSRQSQVTEVLTDLAAQIRPIAIRVWGWWNVALAKLRTYLPESINQKFSDPALTGAIAGILVLVLWITSGLFSSPPPKVATVPPSQRVPPSDLTAPPELSAPETEQPVQTSPSPVIPPIAETPLPKASPPAPSPQISPSPAPAKPAPAKSPEPLPPLNLTPEQSLIAAIQDQVAEITNQYANGLIKAIQANFRQSRLIVKVSPDWYDLSDARQDDVANGMLRRSQELDFSKLEITDPDGRLLARSPVVGRNMVILRRNPLPPLEG